ncbi:MAG TPA: helix-turn-helix transcriptional regulator [Actinoplanes sp.]|nr:helix-turn-helix transcriptional regulator [Actinoplanes sp.]
MTALIVPTTDGEPANGQDPLAVLLSRLATARREARRPTHREIARATGLSASTICRIFKAKRPPSWNNLQRVLHALGIDTDADTTWLELWINADSRANPMPLPIRKGLLAPGRESCPVCGTWIADYKAHLAHHDHLEAIWVTLDQLRETVLRNPDT